MSTSEPASADAAVRAFVSAQQEKGLLRFITCGSVDDGKSTLIGRLLYDARALFTDQVSALQQASSRPGRASDSLDFASIVDGLEQEQDQGITIDVAYRFFATARRKFIIADTPGHEHFTRNMVTGASTADAAVILVDATRGIRTQTRRHSLLVQLLGIRSIVLAVNKMDLVGYREEVFAALVASYAEIPEQAEMTAFRAIPVAALHGDNVVARSLAMRWYDGPCLLEHLESVSLEARMAESRPFRFPIQCVGDLDGTASCAGTVASGLVKRGDPLRLLPGNTPVTVERIVTFDGDLEEARAGQAVTLAIRADVPPGRGDMLCADLPPVAHRLDAMLVWLAAQGMEVGRRYDLKIGTRTIGAKVACVADRVDVNTGCRIEGAPLAMNDIGRCELALDAPVVAIPYSESRTLGGFVLIDPDTRATIAAGMIGGA